jgi:hypothetical protein
VTSDFVTGIRGLGRANEVNRHETFWSIISTEVPVRLEGIHRILDSGNPVKTFTIDEAQSLLPLLESLLKRAIEGKRLAQEVESRLSDLGRRIYLAGGMRVNVAEAGRMRAEMDNYLRRVKESITEIDSIGVQVKDVDSGLLDFPCRVDDEVVLLCWRMGETTIEHWHTVEDGFKGRRPVDERFRRRSNSSNRPN